LRVRAADDLGADRGRLPIDVIQCTADAGDSVAPSRWLTRCRARDRLADIPVVAEQLCGMRGSNAAVAASQVSGGAVALAAPADALGMLGVKLARVHGRILLERLELMSSPTSP